MDVSVYVRPPNSSDYSQLETKEFAVLPRADEFISAKHDGSKKFFQVIAVHHSAEKKGLVEIYAVEAEPIWQAKKSRSIGFGH
jgi:hypothetical protein